MNDNDNLPPLPIVGLAPTESLDLTSPELTELVEVAAEYAKASRAVGTQREYKRHFAHFEAWCAQHGLCPLPAAAQTVALYLAHRAKSGRRVSTLEVALASIWKAHKLADCPSPKGDRLVQEVWAGIRRKQGIAKTKKEPLSTPELRRLMDHLPAGLIGHRDRALVTLGFAGGFRRSELVALDHCDLRFVPEGLEAHVRRSKTDQEGKGLIKPIVYGSDPAVCPVRAVKDWLELSGITEGPVFRPINRHEQMRSQRLTSFAVAVIVKRLAARAGMAVPQLSGHSLRSGFVTESAKNGADYRDIMETTGQVKLETVHGYNRRKTRWERPASAKLGL